MRGRKKNTPYKGETNTSRKENPFYYLSTEGIFFLNIYSLYIYMINLIHLYLKFKHFMAWYSKRISRSCELLYTRKHIHVHTHAHTYTYPHKCVYSAINLYELSRILYHSRFSPFQNWWPGALSRSSSSCVAIVDTTFINIIISFRWHVISHGMCIIIFHAAEEVFSSKGNVIGVIRVLWETWR